MSVCERERDKERNFSLNDLFNAVLTVGETNLTNNNISDHLQQHLEQK